MKAKLDASRSLYETARFVDMYKSHITTFRTTAPSTKEEREEMKHYQNWPICLRRW
jgi:hypothetical protein